MAVLYEFTNSYNLDKTENFLKNFFFFVYQKSKMQVGCLGLIELKIGFP